MPWNMLISEIISHGNYYTALTNANDNQPHCHEFIEIFYVIQGAASHNLNGKQKMVELGDVYLLKPTDFHSFSSVDSAPFLHRDICIKADEFKKVCDFIRPNLYQDLLNDKSVIQSKLNIARKQSLNHSFQRSVFRRICKHNDVFVKIKTFLCLGTGYPVFFEFGNRGHIL